MYKVELKIYASVSNFDIRNKKLEDIAQSLLDQKMFKVTILMLTLTTVSFPTI